MILEFKCNCCGKKFIPDNSGLEYKLRGETILMKCPDCCKADLKNWTLKNVQFRNKNFSSTVSFKLADNKKYEDISYTEVGDGVFLNTSVEYPRQHVSDQLKPLLDSFRIERDRWQANIQFIEEFTGNYIAITAQALKEPLKILYKVREDGTLWIDPKAEPIPPRIKEQIEQTFNKKYCK